MMPTVDEMGRPALELLAASHSQADRAEARAAAMAAKARDLQAHWRSLLDATGEASRKARAAMGTPAFEDLFARVKGLTTAARIAEGAYRRALVAADNLAREARLLRRTS